MVSEQLEYRDRQMRNENRLIRTMTAGDIDSVCSILAVQDLCSIEDLPRRLSGVMGAANADFIVVEQDGSVVGVALSVFDGFTQFVNFMAVALGMERHDIGRQMIDELTLRARKRGGKNIVVSSWLSAAGFYYKMDFRMPGSVFLIRDI